MVYSMTGFATSQFELRTAQTTPISITLTIRSFNSRFFEGVCKLSHSLAPLEHPILQRCKEVLKRGSVTVTLTVHAAGIFHTLQLPSVHTVQLYLKRLQEIQAACQLPGTVQINDITAIPSLFEKMEDPLSPQTQAELLHHVDTVLSLVTTSRQQEGASLQHDLESAINIITKHLEELTLRAETIEHERRERFALEIRTALADKPLDAQDACVHTLAQHLNSINVHEELVRFRAHCTLFLTTLATNQEMHKGKKLDFILQEMLREINTLNAKLVDIIAITPILTIKTKLEQAREQVQNIL